MKRMQWEDWFNLAKNYYNYYGNSDMSVTFKTFDGINYNKNGYGLGKWWDNQKQIIKGHKSGLMTEDRLTMLNSIGLNLGRNNVAWNKGFERVKEYITKYGSENMEDEFVYNWIKKQKQKIKSGILGEEEMKKMASLNIDYTCRKTWDESFEKAKQYYIEHGNLDVPSDYRTTDEYNLYRWLAHQKSEYFVGKLTEEQVNKLNSIGMIWSKYSKWDETFSILEKEFINNEKSSELDDSYREWWITGQRYEYFKGELSEDKIEKMESIGFEWYKYVATLCKQNINDKNQLIIRRELLKLLNMSIEDVNKIEDINSNIIRRLSHGCKRCD